MTGAGAGRGREGGSILADALVALAVLAVVLVSAAAALGSGARRTARVELARSAELVARSHLAVALADPLLQPGRTEGEDGALSWRVDTEPAPELGSQRLLRVTAEARDARGGPALARLSTLKLVGTS